MTNVAYLDCPTGIAGDMCLGAIVDAGVPLTYLIEMLDKLGISNEYQLRAEEVHHNGQRATKIHVDLKTATDWVEYLEPASVSTESAHSHSATETTESADSVIHHLPTHEQVTTPSRHSHAIDEGNEPAEHPFVRHLPEIEHLIRSAGLPARAETWSLKIFRQLAVAEGAVHGIPPEQVHFHEVGATDAIVDIVGTCLGLDWLNIDQLYCSALPTGGGTVRAAHGRLPVPTPAVLKLWEMRQIPIYSNGIQRELVTPTGAAIVTTLAQQFGPPPAMSLQRVGLGAGSAKLPIPNILRLWLGKTAGLEGLGATAVVEQGPFAHQHSHTNSHSNESGRETIAVLETQIDDLSPQAIAYASEALFAAGALDVFTQAIGMKKSRSGVLLTIICPTTAVSACETVLFRETTTLGIRCSFQQRHVLQREIQPVQTQYGTVRVKVAWATDAAHPLNVQPEYEDCAQIARQQQVPWREVHRVTLQTWHLQPR